MKNGKRILAALLSAVLLTGLLAGCGDTGETASNGSSGKEPISAESVGSTGETERMALTFIEVSGREWDPEGEVFKMLEDNYNIDLTIEYVQTATAAASGSQSWYSLRIASGETTPYVPNVTFGDYNNYVKQGVFREVPLDTVKKRAPDMMAWYDEEAGENVWNLFDIEGQNYALPILWSLGNHWTSLAIREDWLNDAGIAKVPETLEEIEAAMKAVKELKGLDYVVSGQGLHSLGWVGGAYDVYFSNFYEGDDGKLYWGEFHPNTKTVLSKLNEWYKTGLLDREFITNKDDMETDRWLNGKTLLLQRYWPDFVSDMAWYGGGLMFSGLKEKDAAAKPVQIPAPKGPDGASGFIMSNPTVGAMCFAADLPDEKLEKYLEIFNNESQHFDRLQLSMKGIEGKHFELDEQGTYVTLPPYDTDETLKIKDGVGLVIPGNFNNYTAQMPFMTAPVGEAERKQYENMNIGKYDVLAATFRPVWAEKGTQFKDFCQKSLIDFITGSRSMDEYDAFVEEAMNQYAGKELLAEAETMFAKIKG